MKRLLASSYCLMIALCIAATSGVVLAQSSAAPDSAKVTQAGKTKEWLSCHENYMEAGAWSPCHIDFQKNEIKQGDDHRTVAIWRPLHVMRLSHFVAGDSATFYARKYERKEAWFNGVSMMGSAMIGMGIVAHELCLKRVCKPLTLGDVARKGMYAGAGLVVISIPIRLSGRKDAYRAVDFFNASLGKGKP